MPSFSSNVQIPFWFWFILDLLNLNMFIKKSSGTLLALLSFYYWRVTFDPCLALKEEHNYDGCPMATVKAIPQPWDTKAHYWSWSCSFFSWWEKPSSIQFMLCVASFITTLMSWTCNVLCSRVADIGSRFMILHRYRPFIFLRVYYLERLSFYFINCIWE